MIKYLISISLLTSVFAFAEADGPDFFSIDVQSHSYLNIRAEGNINSEIIGTINPGSTCVQNFGCKGGPTLKEFTELSEYQISVINENRARWCLIDYKGIKGWVSSKYIVEGSCTQVD